MELDDQKLREVPGQVDKIVGSAQAQAPAFDHSKPPQINHAASGALDNWYAEKVDDLIRHGKQQQAFDLLKTIQGNLGKILDELESGNGQVFDILDKLGLSLYGFLEQPD